jgi:hypothetical protein
MWTQITEGSFMYQRIWSNAAAAAGGDPCVPQSTFFDVSTPQSWFTVAPGQSVPIPLAGFSDGPTADWVLVPAETTSNRPQFAVSISSPTTEQTTGGDLPSTNNGQQATLTFTTPADAKPGDWAIVQIQSIPLGGSSGDPYEVWLVGVHVP